MNDEGEGEAYFWPLVILASGVVMLALFSVAIGLTAPPHG